MSPFACYIHQQKAPITATADNVPVYQTSVCRGKFHPLFYQNKTFAVPILKKESHDLILLNQIIGKYLEPRKEITSFAWSISKIHCKNVKLV